jgi:hypothetical protein
MYFKREGNQVVIFEKLGDVHIDKTLSLEDGTTKDEPQPELVRVRVAAVIFDPKLPNQEMDVPEKGLQKLADHEAIVKDLREWVCNMSPPAPPRPQIVK